MRTNRESPEAKRQREERERVHAEHYIWTCKGCGPCETSRGSWCDLGCGSDHPGMIELPRHIIGKILAFSVTSGLPGAILAWAYVPPSGDEGGNYLGELYRDDKGSRIQPAPDGWKRRAIILPAGLRILEVQS